jgi:hypothetical protein
MSVATYGELLVSGRGHLDAAARLPDSALHTESVIAAMPVIGRLAITLSRYLADVAPYTMAEAITSRYLGQRMPPNCCTPYRSTRRRHGRCTQKTRRSPGSSAESQ